MGLIRLGSRGISGDCEVIAVEDIFGIVFGAIALVAITVVLRVSLAVFLALTTAKRVS